MILITLVVIGYKEVVASANTKTSSRENSDQHPDYKNKNRYDTKYLEVKSHLTFCILLIFYF